LFCGYPVGGENISVTSGVVSRIEVTEYCNASNEMLGIQIDAAINDGNSGGPAFNEKGKCIGVAFQSMNAGEAENIGYIIPVPIVEHFLKDWADNGDYLGFPSLACSLEVMESPLLRKAYGMETGQKGMLVTRVSPLGSAAGVVELQDVLLEFDKKPIGNDGTVVFRTHERVDFQYLVQQKFIGDKCSAKVLRKGQIVDLDIELKSQPHLVSMHLRGAAPSYFIVGGLVFTVLTVPYMKAQYGEEWDNDAPVDLVHFYGFGEAKKEDQCKVVLCHVLAHDCTVGYESLEKLVVNKVDGVEINNLQHLVDLVVGGTSEWVTFGLSEDKIICLQRETVMSDTKEVLAKHTIPAVISSDLKLPPLPG
jgi:hypothetical protein